MKVKSHMDTGSASECFIAQVWRSQEKYDLDDETVAYVRFHQRLFCISWLTHSDLQLGGSSFEAGYVIYIPSNMTIKFVVLL